MESFLDVFITISVARLNLRVRNRPGSTATNSKQPLEEDERLVLLHVEMEGAVRPIVSRVQNPSIASLMKCNICFILI